VAGWESSMPVEASFAGAAWLDDEAEAAPEPESHVSSVRLVKPLTAVF